MSSKSEGSEITKAELTEAFRSLTGGASRVAQAAAPSSPSVVAIAVSIGVGLVFVLGYMRGRRKSSVVEIKRL
ncbi:hypothetical protein SAMN02745225_01995 [Ferrithrix thermotolerans DSM 19514]|uniref:Uncharacterized protein n=1 Tax=Ferrithrix thermotolerans DSM 19514 TaxID=1121881 RepID=A0A1M4XEJ6_9ACTN|nr:hypothetical protein [Ferrithrix thermotolerans]SHE92027.1 hypothetical protein SAMN02745225_01995 [Ferrithrix thermotolerans DSM 19514]